MPEMGDTKKSKTEFVNWVLMALEADNELSSSERLLIIVIAWRGNANGELVDYRGRPISLATCAKKANVSNRGRAIRMLTQKGWLIKHKVGGRLNLEKVNACYQRAKTLLESQSYEGCQNVTSPGDKMSPLQVTNCHPIYSHTKKYNSASRNFSSWTDKGDDVVLRPTMNCSTEII